MADTLFTNVRILDGSGEHPYLGEVQIQGNNQIRVALPGIEDVLSGEDACRRFGLPPDREGDFVVLGDRGTVVGARAAEHDLSGLAGHRLRSHGGLGEQRVPFLVSEPLTASYLAGKPSGLRNFDIFDAVLNGTA